MKAFLRNLRGVITFGVLTLNTIVWFTPLFVLAIIKLLLPVPPLRRAITRVLMWIGEQWVSVNTLILSGSGARRWTADGLEDLGRDKWYLVLSNHQTWVDIVVLQEIFNRRVPFLKFFIKQELVWFPLLGIAWWAMDMPFMKRYSPSYLARHPEKRGADLEATRRACRKFQHTPTSVINFIEGTRFSEEKRDRRESPYRHLLPPRAGGIAIALSSMGKLFDAVLDVTLYYPEGPPTFWGMCCGDSIPVTASVRQLPVEDRIVEGDYASDREFRREVHRWISNIWREKDEQLESLAGVPEGRTSGNANVA